ncbi:hypothetical protein [Bifidobacterium castoris]|uniref:Phage tail protein n=1 Tax=Bifidobacterium castoris TaxID=2306972 RepID=A0A430F4I4_9BIFI|nr:hypothetical protein [Bifidobacterium castoris]RSX44705.1 hypothetical protein D2E22_1991 [Bifidobacterium castoris]
MSVAFLELSANGVAPVRFECEPGPAPRLFFLEEGIDGWYSTPDLKVSTVERGNGDGAHDVPESCIDYATRTVQATVGALGGDRAETLRLWDLVRRFAHRLVRLRLVDDDHDCFVEGMLRLEGPAEWEADWMQGVVTVVCNRPEILATSPQTGQMLPVLDVADGNGLSYNQRGLETYWTGEPNNSISVLRTDMLRGTSGLAYPLTYLTRRKVVRPNQVTFTNQGSSPAYPVFTCNGPMPNGVDLVVEGTGQWLRCSQPVYGEPLVLDCRSRTAQVGGLDVSRTLVSRGFPIVPPHGSVTVTLRTSGDGWVDALMRDTWM